MYGVCRNWIRTVSYTHLDVYKRQGRMVRLFCQLVCGSGRTYSKGSSAKVFCLYGRCGFVSGKEKMACLLYTSQEAFVSGDFTKDKLAFITKNRLGKVLPGQARSGFATYTPVAFDFSRLAQDVYKRQDKKAGWRAYRRYAKCPRIIGG